MESMSDRTQELEPIEPDAEKVSKAVVEAYESFPGDFRARWDLYGEIDPIDLAQRVRNDFEEQPRERREILIAYLARRIGYRWYLHRSTNLTVQPLWDLLRRESFEQLTEADREILWMVACTTQKIRQTLHPKAALAAIALWRFGAEEEQALAEKLLRTLGLPTRMHFLYDLVRELGRRSAERDVDDTRDLFALAMLQLDAELWDVATLMGGLYFVRRYDPWYTGSPRTNLETACDRAAAEQPFRYRHWIMMMADAAVSGELTSSWLEMPVQSAIRLTVGDRRQNERFRAFHRLRLYEAPRERLRKLYAPWLHRLGLPGVAADLTNLEVKAALDHLTEEVERTAAVNPFRAMRLLELVAERVHGRALPAVLHRILELDPLTERLLTLYVRCCHLDPVAVRFVREHKHQVDWDHWADVEPGDVTAFRLVGDYEATFGARDVKLLGVPIVHVDKDAAARVHYFQTSRTNPNSVAKLLNGFDIPSRLPVSRIGESGMMSDITIDLVDFFVQEASRRDLRGRVIEDLRRIGSPVREWEDIGALPITRIEQALVRGRQRDLLVGAASGGLAGVLSPITTGLSSIMDVPFIMALVADTCARHCWYYGFDPRARPELPVKIVAVALGGVSAANMPSEEVRRQLQRYLVKRSMLLAAIGQGALAQIAGPMAGMLLEHLGKTRRRTPLLVGALNRIARGERKRQRPLTRKMTRIILPAADGFLGAAFNVSLVYDLCESAQAVLADEFLARKYPDWETKT